MRGQKRQASMSTTLLTSAGQKAHRVLTLTIQSIQLDNLYSRHFFTSFVPLRGQPLVFCLIPLDLDMKPLALEIK